MRVNSAVLFDQAPVGVKAPEKSVIIAGRKLALIGFTGIFDLSDSCAVGTAVAVGAVNTREVDVIVGIQQDSKHLVLAQSQ